MKKLEKAKKTGRKSKFTPELAKKLIDLAGEGMPMSYALQAVGLGKSAFYKWVEQGERDQAKGVLTHFSELAEGIKRAEAAFISTHLKNIEDHSVKSWQASAWLLERRFPSEFSTRAQTVGETSQGLKIVIVPYALPKKLPPVIDLPKPD